MQGTQDYPPWVIPSEHAQLDFVRIKHIGLALQCYAWRSRRHSGGVAEWWSRMVPLSHPVGAKIAIPFGDRLVALRAKALRSDCGTERVLRERPKS
jgi:hypothetical protein